MISLKIIFLNLINYLYSPQKKPGSSPAEAFSLWRIYVVFDTDFEWISPKIMPYILYTDFFSIKIVSQLLPYSNAPSPSSYNVCIRCTTFYIGISKVTTLPGLVSTGSVNFVGTAPPSFLRFRRILQTLSEIFFPITGGKPTEFSVRYRSNARHKA